MSEQNIKLTVAYDGTAYHGWQRQKNGISVQQTLERALSAVYGESIIVHGAGRTDAGVHAWGQTVSFRAHSPLPIERLPMVVNAQLPDDIRLREAEIAEHSFHARYSAKGKRYRYLIEQSPADNPFSGRYSWNVKTPLDIAAMEEAAACLMGEHDFRHYTTTAVSAENFVRTITALDIRPIEAGDGILPWRQLYRPLSVEVAANGFLYKMVRIIVGRLTAVGRGQLEPEKIAGFLDGSYWRNIPPAPAQGLMLMDVYY